jgi:hypothetical protein
MKLRKILPLLGLATVALLALSSCDQMLQSLFPAETGQLKTQGKDSISVQVTVDTTYPVLNQQLRVELWDPTYTTMYDSRVFTVSDTGYRYNDYKADFNWLVDGTYNVDVWIDENGNKIPDDNWWDYGTPWEPQYTVNAGTPNQTATVTVP